MINNDIFTQFVSNIIASKEHVDGASIVFTPFGKVFIPEGNITLERDTFKIKAVYFLPQSYIHLLFSYKKNFYFIVFSGILLEDNSLLCKIEHKFEEEIKEDGTSNDPKA